MLDIEKVPLEDLCDPARGITYGIVKVGNFIPDGVPVIRGGDIRDNRIVFDNDKRVSQEVSNQFARTILRGGELVMNLISESGHCAMVPESMCGFNVSRDVAVIALGESVNHSYVNWYLKSPAAIEWVTARLSGSVTQKINLGVLRQVPIPILPPTHQSAIVDLLDALDDRISINHRIASTADSLRSALLNDARKLAPGDFVAQPLSHVAEFINGRAFTKDATGHGRMVVRIAEMNSGPGPSTVYNDIAVDEKHLARPGDVLFSWSGSLVVMRWFRPEAIINQHIFKVVPRAGNPLWLAFGAVQSKLADYRAVAADKATTMGHIQRRHLDEEVVVPGPEAIARLGPQASTLWQRALIAEQESLTLAALRDSLLPELMSGRLRVRDAEKVVEKAV